jgi:hypothetical protein
LILIPGVTSPALDIIAHFGFVLQKWYFHLQFMIVHTTAFTLTGWAFLDRHTCASPADLPFPTAHGRLHELLNGPLSINPAACCA